MDEETEVERGHLEIQPQWPKSGLGLGDKGFFRVQGVEMKAAGTF